MARGSFADYLDGHDGIVTRTPLVTMASFCGGTSERKDEPHSAGDSARVRAALYKKWLHARERHRRDNYVLESAMKYVLGIYEHHAAEFEAFQQKPDQPASFKRVRGCGSTLGSVTPAMLSASCAAAHPCRCTSTSSTPSSA